MRLGSPWLVLAALLLWVADGKGRRYRADLCATDSAWRPIRGFSGFVLAGPGTKRPPGRLA